MRNLRGNSFAAGSIVACLGASSLAQTTWYVDAANAGDPSKDGSAAHPFDRVQSAFDQASDGDTVLVFPGVYVQILDLLGKDLLVLSVAGEAATVLDGSGFGPVLTAFGTDSQIDGFELAHGNNPFGGACDAVQASITFSNCLFRENESRFGGAVSGDESNLILIGSRFLNNAARDSHRHFTGDGGAISIYNSNATVINCSITGNFAARKGGGVSVETFQPPFPSSVGFFSCVIDGNTVLASGSGAGGGGFSISRPCSASLRGCTVVRNNGAAAGQAAGLHIWGGASVSLDSTIVWANTETTLPNVKIASGATLSVGSSVLQGGQAAVMIDNATLTWGAGNLSSDPQFVDLVAGDYRLQPCSSAVNSGDPVYAPVAGETSADGGPRIFGDRVDMGAYELVYADANDNGVPDECETPCPGDTNADGRVDLVDLATLLTHFGTPSGATLADGDLDADGDVDLVDLATLLVHFGSQC
jgi:hypothetical protein